jgi:6-phosphogluconate dehydrogenase
MASSQPVIGLFGLAVMGQNLALNIAERGFHIAVCNRSPGKVDDAVARAKAEGSLPLTGYKDVGEFVESLRRPRAVIILVQAGKPVDETIEVLSAHMDAGDLIIDGGNEWFPNTLRRGEELRKKGLLFMGMGVSGGEEGARNGPSLMPGGPREAYDLVQPILTAIAAKTDSGPCVTWVGELGSGNYVKMVHNGIEYGDMQLIAESYDILKTVGGLSNDELQAVFAEWNRGELDSFLIEITAQIFRKKEEDGSGRYVVDAILDKTGMKGTGKMTIQEAAERSIAAPTMAAALDARFLSGLKEERVEAAKVLSGPADLPKVDRAQLIDDVRQALYAAKICSYAQGMNLIREAAKQLKWTIDLGECARIWKGGCIIRAKVGARRLDAGAGAGELGRGNERGAGLRPVLCGAARLDSARGGREGLRHASPRPPRRPEDDPALYMLDVLRGDADASNTAELTGRRRRPAGGRGQAGPFAAADSPTSPSIRPTAPSPCPLSAVPGPDQEGVRPQPGARQPACRPGVRRRGERAPGRLAPRRGALRGLGHRVPELLGLARLLRPVPPRAPAREPHAGAARLLRRARLRARGRPGQPPHRVGQVGAAAPQGLCTPALT